MTQSQSLNTRAMLSTLNISVWTATRTDKRASREVAQAHGVNERRAGHYRKHAIDTSAPSYVAVKSAAGALREKHYWHTLPWNGDGARILPAASFATYSADIRHLKDAFESAVADFLADYPRLHRNAEVELNGLFNPGDYPRDIRAKFDARTTIMPLPDASDFRVKLADGAAAEIRAAIKAETQDALATAMRDPYQRLLDHMHRMVERLGDPEGQFRDTLVTGLAELCAVLPALNLTGDAQLDELRAKAEGMIAGISAQDIRDDKQLRASIATQAKEIEDAMSAFMGGTDE